MNLELMFPFTCKQAVVARVSELLAHTNGISQYSEPCPEKFRNRCNGVGIILYIWLLRDGWFSIKVQWKFRNRCKQATVARISELFERTKHTITAR